LLQGLSDQFDRLLVDEAAHYSVHDAATGSGKATRTFRHGDAESLREVVRASSAAGARPLVMADGVSPVLGDIAPVPDYLRVLDDVPGAGLYLDDAHAVGVLGEHGRGTFEHWASTETSIAARLPAINTLPQEGVSSHRAILLHSATLSKAIGGFGGIIAGSRAFIERLKRSTAWHHGASAPPAAAAAASAAGLRIVAEQPALRRQLRDNVLHLRAGLRSLGFDVPDSPVPVLCLQLPSAAAMQQIQAHLAARDMVIAYIKSYSGLGEHGGLRIAVGAGHLREMIDQLVAAIGEETQAHAAT
jgi:7-keto-8-aminopelargonate synthetase-like enzyme